MGHLGHKYFLLPSIENWSLINMSQCGSSWLVLTALFVIGTSGQPSLKLNVDVEVNQGPPADKLQETATGLVIQKMINTWT